MFHRTNNSHRRGGIYVVVLGTSMIVAMLGLSALVGQRIQNRLVTASADVRQAQLNAHSAVELALLTMKHGCQLADQPIERQLVYDRNTGTGTCSLTVTDPLDATSPTTATTVTVLGIGNSGKAEQRCEVMLDPPSQTRRRPRAPVPDSGGRGITGQSAVDWNTHHRVPIKADRALTHQLRQPANLDNVELGRNTDHRKQPGQRRLG